MSTHRGSHWLALMVTLLAFAASELRGQATPDKPIGKGVLPTPTNQAGRETAAGTAQFPKPAASSQLGSSAQAAPAAYPAMLAGTPTGAWPYGPAPAMYPGMAYGYPGGVLPAYGGVSPVAFADAPSAAPQPFPMTPAQPLGPAPGFDVQTASYAAEGICPNCGGGGCLDCLGVAGAMGRRLTCNLPYSEGGSCAPRWYDVTAEYVFLNREKAGRRVDFTSDGILGDILLSTESLDFDGQGGFRFTGAAQVWAGGTLEFTYLGLVNWATSANVIDASGNLWGPFSQFGLLPPIDEVDQAIYHGIAYSSSIDSFELHFRKRWVGPNCRLQGSWLAGVRYVYLLEDFEFLTVGGDDPSTPWFDSRGQMDYDIRTKNSLTGFQCGGDLWSCIVPGISFGGEVKGGIYGNYSKQGTHILGTTTAQQNLTKDEADTNTDLALVAESSLVLVYRTSPHWTVRGGYTFLYMDGLALAPENFNSTFPIVGRPAKPVNDNGTAFYHGFTAGVEWMW